jgi:beta-1,4-mannosyl-glycoprotein beta-1,4-N-acetylglucosaminyltransferase
MKIIDAFIFYNELDILNYRLNILHTLVDHFILVESTHTFVGKPKSLIYKENAHMFERFKDKIFHVVVDDMPHIPANIETNEQWKNETHQRNCIDRAIQQLNLNDEDIIIISDVDEIPDPNTIYSAKMNYFHVSKFILLFDMYYYNLNNRFVNKWLFVKILNYGIYKDEIYNQKKTVNDIRRSQCNVIPRGGWHLSYFGNTEFIKNKIENFSHQEYNKEQYTNPEKIKEIIEKGTDLFGRDGEVNIVKIARKDNDYFPYAIEHFLGQYIKF